MPIRFAAFAACLLACAPVEAAAPPQAPASAQVPAEVPAYAPLKERVCSDCPMPRPGIALPRHAVVVGTWGFFNQGTDFQVLDLDTGTLVHAFVPAPAVPGRQQPKGKRSTVTLPRSALPPLVALANRIWAYPQPIPSRSATDIAWNLWLIDGRQVRHETGAGLPAGLAAEWMHCVDKLLGAEHSSLHQSPR
ncbi:MULTISPECIES: hypothetical protein [unclassified Massilia]|uniref:hypothetical protein n=1 Tax=unclassified Massilia TaxID=2609279 RepID=UPI000AF5D389|nr:MULTISPECIES: hypothetical protein [unclassified Massilia]